MGIEYTIGFVCGVLIEAIVALIMRLIRTTQGTLKIDRSNPEKDVYRLEIDNLDKLVKKKRVELAVKLDVDLSQK